MFKKAKDIVVVTTLVWACALSVYQMGVILDDFSSLLEEALDIHEEDLFQ